MASKARTGQLRRRTRMSSVPVPIEDPVTLMVRDIQQNIINMQKQYECPICLELISEPRGTECGHYFCKDCIFKHLSTSHKKKHIKCPICKETVTKRSLGECYSMEEISNGISNIIQGFQIDIGTNLSVPYVHSIGNKVTNEKPVLTIALEGKAPENKEEIVTKDISIMEPSISHLEVTQTKDNSEKKDEATKFDSEQRETSLENQIKGSSMTNKCPGFGQSKHSQKKKDIKNIISDILGISSSNFDQSNSSFKPFRSHNNEPQATGFSKAINFQPATNKTVENGLIGTETEDLFKSKRLKNENEVAFVSGANIFDLVARDKECEPIKSQNCQTVSCSQNSDIFSTDIENFSCLDEFSPVKCVKKRNLNETYDVLPLDDLELTEQQTGTKRARSETEEYIYEGDILDMTFSDQSNPAISESKTKLEPNEDEITLTQFFTQQPVLPRENDHIRYMNIPEPSLASSTVRFQEDPSIAGFSIELSKDIVSVNQSKFELELKGLISETETLDSLIFTQPTITGYSIPNQIVPEINHTQYSLMDIFSPTQENTSSPKLARTELCQNATQKNEHLEQNLTDISFENFNNTTRVTSPIVSKELQNSLNEITIPKQEILNFSNFSEIFKSGATQLEEIHLTQVDT